MNTPIASSPFITQLTGFVDDLRGRGIVVGPANLIDAGQATSVLDLLDRNSFREGMACTLLHDNGHRRVFDAVFDLWFPLGMGERSGDQDDAFALDADGNVDIEAVRERLAELLADDSKEAEAELASFAAMAVAQLGSYRSSRGPAFSTYQAMSTINPQTLIAQIAAAMAGSSGDEDRSGTEPVFRRAAADRVRQFRSLIESETKRRMAQRNGREQVSQYAVPNLPERVNFLSAGAADLAEVRRTIAPLARLLAARLEVRRRRAHRGSIDVRKTLRASMSTGGVPIDLVRRKPRPGRPELVVLCDVSGSVAGFSQFTLQLVYALRQQFSKVRVFAFVDTVDEVTEFFDGPDLDFTTAVREMLSQARLITRDGHSDYGNAFSGFASDHLDALTRRGALLILGDGRNNYHDPKLAALTQMVDSTRHAYWLNPEASRNWDTGDSVASTYSGVIDMHECRNATQLGKVIANLLPV
ncbi:vWA domain-containing protein [Williamsia soli]|uniref:vWA domain-containing protein n=1 Tax=Williamsia soli TaxID=364929 RepID=UPI0027DE2379|nr:VWA domain-containing protein [Williamsia soli]